MGGAEDESGHRKISHGLVRNFRYKLAACRSNSGASRAILEAVANYYWHIIARLWVRLEARKILQILPSGLREAQSEPLARRSNFVVLTRAGLGGLALWAHHKDDLSRERPLELDSHPLG